MNSQTMEVPPPYSITDDLEPSLEPIVDLTVPPKYYSLPPTFSIGKKHSPHLVNISQIKGHLALLNTFAVLKNKVRELHRYHSGSGTVSNNLPIDHDLRWVWFVSLAVERFTIWCQSFKAADLSKPATEFLPPIDVLMVWHTYMLNPGWYAEDCDRLPIMANMAKATQIFSASLSADLQTIITSEPSEPRCTLWTSRTARSWDAIEDAQGQFLVRYSCPQCRKPVMSPYMNAEGTGYFQHNFKAFCDEPTCPKRRPDQLMPSRVCIDKHLLRARKFMDDLFREGKDLQAYLAGSVRTPYMNIDVDKATRVKNLIRDAVVLKYVGQRPSGISQNNWAALVLEKTIYGFKELETSVLQNTAESDRGMVERVFSAYQTERPFSVELVGAVIRQGSFIEKMEQLEWTKPAYFADRKYEVALQHAIARYHAFLDLLSAHPRSFNIPTLDIDLAWHTHQLMGPEYNIQCRDTIGRYIDHNDKVEESKLATSFDSTSIRWKQRFGLPYVHCGCPVPGRTIGKKLHNILSSSSTSRIYSPPYLDPPNRADIISATHPSDHDSVIFLQTREERKRVVDDQFHRREKSWKLSQELLKSEFKQKQKAKTLTRAHDSTFEIAFLSPLPCSTYTSCASYHGHVDTGTTGIAACAPTPSSPPPARMT